MKSRKGKFIVIEGIDGSGKATQLKKLSDFLKSKNHKIATFDFPQYDKPSSYFVREYLNGRYGPFEEVGPQLASTFFALDRYDAKKEIMLSLTSGKIVLSNRYIGSNMAHQGSNLNSLEDREKYFNWIENFEFEILGIPKPDLNIILHVSADIVQRFVDMKDQRTYIASGAKRDILEANINHLKKAENTYKEMAEIFPDQFVVVECMKDNEIMSLEEVHSKVVSIVEPFLN